MWTIAVSASVVAGSGFRIAADHLKGAEPPLREVPAQYVPARRRYPARRPCQPWPGSSVSGGKTSSDSAYYYRLAETGEMVIGSGEDTMSNGAVASLDPDDLRPPPGTFVTVERLIT